MRTPAPLPPLVRTRAHPLNVIVVLGESVRADAMCSVAPPMCTSAMLDEAAGDRIPLGRLTTQTPNTFSACLLLWTGLAPNVDVRTAHTAPVLWEVARAAGYRTGYLSAQNASYDNFAAFVKDAGIDRLVTGGDLGGVAQEQLGAPDERAFDEGLRFARDAGPLPYFAVVHLSNTHAPYRTDPALHPYEPASDDPLGDQTQFHNWYRNAVRLEERMLAAFLRELRGLPSWGDTVVLVLSDHGEQFFEHGSAYHNHSLYEQELRVPGWIVAGSRALSDDERIALRAYGARRTYLTDVHATVLDLLGVDHRALPYDNTDGRSLLQMPRPGDAEPLALLSTASAVWEPDIALIGALQGDRKVAGPAGGDATAFSCVDVARRPLETATSVPDAWCRPMIDEVRAAFGPASGAL
jgi:membrane-anchored protein YejM (alkaline phosphatase superfamily)